MNLQTQVLEHHVDEAIRLFKFSTMDAIQSGMSGGGSEGRSKTELGTEMSKIESEIRKRLPIGWNTSYANLVKQFVNEKGYSQHALERCLYVLEKREVIRFSQQKKNVIRVGVVSVHRFFLSSGH
jgi:DNA replication licensing factor MCM5